MSADTDWSAVADSVYREFVEDERRERAKQQLEELQDEIASLRAEVEKYRKDAIRWDWLMNDYHGGNVARANKVLAGCWNRSQMEEAIDKDLAERDQAAMGASA